MSEQTVEEQLRAAQAELKELKAEKKPGTITLKATPKGCIGFYGLRRMPIVLYPQEWEKMVAIAGEVEEFVEQNRGVLSFK